MLELEQREAAREALIIQQGMEEAAALHSEGLKTLSFCAAKVRQGVRLSDIPPAEPQLCLTWDVCAQFYFPGVQHLVPGLNLNQFAFDLDEICAAYKDSRECTAVVAKVGTICPNNARPGSMCCGKHSGGQNLESIPRNEELDRFIHLRSSICVCCTETVPLPRGEDLHEQHMCNSCKRRMHYACLAAQASDAGREPPIIGDPLICQSCNLLNLKLWAVFMSHCPEPVIIRCHPAMLSREAAARMAAENSQPPTPSSAVKARQAAAWLQETTRLQEAQGDRPGSGVGHQTFRSMTPHILDPGRVRAAEGPRRPGSAPAPGAGPESGTAVWLSRFAPADAAERMAAEGRPPLPPPATSALPLRPTPPGLAFVRTHAGTGMPSATPRLPGSARAAGNPAGLPSWAIGAEAGISGVTPRQPGPSAPPARPPAPTGRAAPPDTAARPTLGLRAERDSVICIEEDSPSHPTGNAQLQAMVDRAVRDTQRRAAEALRNSAAGFVAPAMPSQALVPVVETGKDLDKLLRDSCHHLDNFRAGQNEDYLVLKLTPEHQLRAQRLLDSVVDGLVLLEGSVRRTSLNTKDQSVGFEVTTGKLVTAEKGVYESKFPTLPVFHEYARVRCTEIVAHVNVGRGAFGRNNEFGVLPYDIQGTPEFHQARIWLMLATYASLYHLAHVLTEQYDLPWHKVFSFLYDWRNKVWQHPDLKEVHRMLGDFTLHLPPKDYLEAGYDYIGRTVHIPALRLCAKRAAEILTKDTGLYRVDQLMYTPYVHQQPRAPAAQAARGRVETSTPMQKAPKTSTRHPCVLCGSLEHQYIRGNYGCTAKIVRACSGQGKEACGYFHARTGPRTTKCGADAQIYNAAAAAAWITAQQSFEDQRKPSSFQNTGSSKPTSS